MDANLRALYADLLSGDDQLAERAALNLGACSAAALPPLQELLQHRDAERRWWAVRALAAIRLPEVPPLLSAAFEDEDLSVRQCAALGLRAQPDPAALPALLAALGDGDRLLARLAGNALSALGEAAVLGLIDRLEAAAPPVRGEAARALALIGDKRSIPALFNVLDDGSPLVSLWAEEGLARMGVGTVFFSSR